eukprot:12969-Heterococcus_DN1.PRE.2
MHTHSSSSSSSTAAAAAAGSATDKQYQHTLCTCSEPCQYRGVINGQDHADLAPADSSTASIAACAQLLVEKCANTDSRQSYEGTCSVSAHSLLSGVVGEAAVSER